MPRVLPRILLALSAGLVVLLLFEGALSLLTGRSLRRRALAELDLVGLRDQERFAAAARNQGIYQVHADPRVGYTLRAAADFTVLEGTVTTDRLGMRRRVGPDPSPDAVRVVVVGDSVAFGMGVDDDQTIAHHLEDVLTGGAAAPRDVACFTAAVPGWNHRNSMSFLLDHLDVIDPDVVVVLPVGNDLADTDGVYETGHRRVALDVASRDPWLSVNSNRGQVFLAALAERARGRDDGARALEDLGVIALGSDITPTSTLRLDDNAATLTRGRDRLAAAGAALLVAHYVDSKYALLLSERLLAATPPLPVATLLTHVPRDGTLGYDPHPNAASNRALALRIAEELVAADLLPARDLPALDPEYEAVRPVPRDPQQVVAAAADVRSQHRDALRDRVDLETGHGAWQSFGGINGDFTATSRLLFVLRRGSERLTVTLAPLDQRPDLGLVSVAVQVDGVEVGTVPVAPGDADARVTRTFALPAASSRQPSIEVGLVPRDWVVTEDRGRSQIASFRPISIQCR